MRLSETEKQRERWKNDKGSDDDEHTRQTTPSQILRFPGSIFDFLFSESNVVHVTDSQTFWICVFQPVEKQQELIRGVFSGSPFPPSQILNQQSTQYLLRSVFMDWTIS